jgi:glyoxylase-like metal-dependent hydrolase (beta-lactamase superfamily II)
MPSYQIHRYASNGTGSVNTYVVETTNALVVIDGQRQIHHARECLKNYGTSGKPLLAVFITHEHPDHVGGLAEFRNYGGPDMPVHASAATREAVELDGFGFYQLSKQYMGDDFARPEVEDWREVKHGEEITLDGLTYRVHELGPGEAASLTAFELIESAELFCGDLVANRMMPFLMEGRSRPWLAQLHAFAQKFAHIQKLYCGHGDPAPPQELVPKQIEYLERFRSRVESAITNGALPDDKKQEVCHSMESDYPNQVPVAEIPSLMERNAEAIARELLKEQR